MCEVVKRNVGLATVGLATVGLATVGLETGGVYFVKEMCSENLMSRR